VHAYPDRDVRLFFFEARIVSGEPQKLEVADLRWVTLDELMDYQFPEADLPLLEQLRGNRC
jgi:8-oxo-dGTP diphosphatase